jgi:hypothetical protein
MSSSERSLFLGVSFIAVLNLLTLALAFTRFIRAGYGGDFFNLLPFASLFFANLYAWLIPIKALRALARTEAALRTRLSRNVFGLSLIALLAVQTGLMLTRSMR